MYNEPLTLTFRHYTSITSFDIDFGDAGERTLTMRIDEYDLEKYPHYNGHYLVHPKSIEVLAVDGQETLGLLALYQTIINRNIEVGGIELDVEEAVAV